MAVEEEKRKRQGSAGSLQLQIQRRRAAISGQGVKTGIGPRRQIHKTLGELEGFRAFFAIQTEHEVGLHKGDVSTVKLGIISRAMCKFASRHISNISDEITQLAVQGKDAEATLQKLTV